MIRRNELASLLPATDLLGCIFNQGGAVSDDKTRWDFVANNSKLAMGDMGAHLIDHRYWELNLGYATSIEATPSPLGGPSAYPMATNMKLRRLL